MLAINTSRRLELYLTSLFFAIVGTVIAILVSSSISSLNNELHIMLYIDGFLIPFMPILFNYISNIFEEEFKNKFVIEFILIEAFFIFSLIFTIFALPSFNFITLPIKLTQLNLQTDIALLFLSLSFVFLLLPLIVLIGILYKIKRAIQTASFDLIREPIRTEFTYLPIYCVEELPDIKFIEEDLNNKEGMHWYNKEGLKIRIGLADQRLASKQDREKAQGLIDGFCVDFNLLVPRVYEAYINVIKELDKITNGNKILETALFDTLISCKKESWPNIYSKIISNSDLKREYEELKEKLDGPAFTHFKKIRLEAIELKDKYVKEVDKLVKSPI